MFGLTPDVIILLTIVAAFSQAVVLAVTLFVFYKNLVVLKKHNELTIQRFTFQSNVEKYDLTLKFADWVKSELSDYLPYVIGDTKHDYLNKEEIKEHFDNIAENMIHLITNKIVFQSLMRDEIKKMHSTLETIDANDIVISKLRTLLKNEK